MNVIIHDLSQEDFERLFPVPPKDTTVISDKGTIQKCVGCFGCWLKTTDTFLYGTLVRNHRGIFRRNRK